MLYSKSTGGFYLQSIHGESIPSDVVEILEDEYHYLLSAQSQGKVIGYDSKTKKPIAKDNDLNIIVINKSVTMRQIRLALLANGNLQSVNTYINNLTGNGSDSLRIEWEYSQEIKRDSALLNAISSAISISAAKLDELFIAASSL